MISSETSARRLSSKQYSVLEDIIEKTIVANNRKILLLGYTGSILYGTDSEKSDIDLKGIFIPSIDELLMNTFPQELNFSTGNNNKKNECGDIDITIFSIHKFFNLMKKGETNTYDLFFSMFNEDCVLMLDPQFKAIMSDKDVYSRFFSKNFNAFVGYCVSQMQKYGIRGERLVELKAIIELTKTLRANPNNKTVQQIIDSLQNTNFKYVKTSNIKDRLYLTILGKHFICNMKIEEFLGKLVHIRKQYGDRVENVNKGIDFKALSHAYRVLLESEEIIDTQFIKFPLSYADKIKAIKYSQSTQDADNVIDEIRLKLDEINNKLEESKLPKQITKSNSKFLDNIMLSFIKSMIKG